MLSQISLPVDASSYPVLNFFIFIVCFLLHLQLPRFIRWAARRELITRKQTSGSSLSCSLSFLLLEQQLEFQKTRPRRRIQDKDVPVIMHLGTRIISSSLPHDCVQTLATVSPLRQAGRNRKRLARELQLCPETINRSCLLFQDSFIFNLHFIFDF